MNNVCREFIQTPLGGDFENSDNNDYDAFPPGGVPRYTIRVIPEEYSENIDNTYDEIPFCLAPAFYFEIVCHNALSRARIQIQKFL
jgi:hypothetical protein